MNKLNTLDWIALILIIIGGLNWFLVGIFSWNLVAAIFGDTATDISIISRIIYILVGLSAIYTIFMLGKLQKK